MYRSIETSFLLNGGVVKRSKLASAAAFALTMLVVTAVAGCSGTTTTTQNKALYVANTVNVVVYQPAQLKAGTAATVPHAIINSPTVFGCPQGVFFNAAGDMWVIDGGNMSQFCPANTNMPNGPGLLKFSAAKLMNLAATNTLMPDVTIRSASLVFPQQAVFDGNGNLFVTDNGGDTVYEFTAAQLAAGGTAVVPNLTITSANPNPFNGPLGIIRDAAGDLLVANNGGTNIFKFNAAKIPASGSVNLTPDVILSDNGKGSIQGPWALAFDTAGNLVVDNANAPFSVSKFSPAQLTMSNNNTPMVTITQTTTGGNQTLSGPNGACLDAVGDVTVMNSMDPFSVSLYTPTQINMGGALVPNVFIVGAATTLNAPEGCTFGPIH